MSQNTATIKQAAGPSYKCPNCGLRTFAGTDQCKRCKTDLSLPLNGTNNDKQIPVDSGEGGRSRIGLAWIIAAVALVSVGLVLFYMRQSPDVTVAAKSEARVAQPATAGAEQPAEDPAEQNSRSEEVAAQVLADLKRFQHATESGMVYSDYEQKLTQLQAEMDSALPAFVRHEPTDETFRQEINGAVRDYIAAGKWWKTSIRNDGVFTEADRKERTQALWDSAKTHLTNAEKMMQR